MKPMTQEWVDKAEGDANVVATVWQMADPVYDAICFHAQQCVEKYCKAWLVEQDIDFPRTHDLEALAKLCLPSLAALAALLDDLRFLTSFAVEIRYPGIFVTQAVTALELPAAATLIGPLGVEVVRGMSLRVLR